MAHEIGAGGDELLERRIDVEEIDIGDEAIDAGVDAGRRLAVQVAARGQEVRQHLQIRKAALAGGLGSVAPDALEMVALALNSRAFSRASGVRLGCSRISASRNSGQNRSSFQREYDITQ